MHTYIHTIASDWQLNLFFMLLNNWLLPVRFIKCFGSNSDKLEVKSMIAESSMALEINSRKITTHPVSNIHLPNSCCKYNTAHTIILYEAAWDIGWMQKCRAHNYSIYHTLWNGKIFTSLWAHALVHTNHFSLALVVKSLLPNHISNLIMWSWFQLGMLRLVQWVTHTILLFNLSTHASVNI